MGNLNPAVDQTVDTAQEPKGSGKPTGIENVKNIISDTLHTVAEVLSKNDAQQNGQSDIAQCGKQASEWLDQSAEYVRQFDCEKADARVRDYIGQNTGRTLLIAGGVGLIIGALLRRR